jgi:replicative DNA helicase
MDELFNFPSEISVISTVLKNPQLLEGSVLNYLKPHVFSSEPNKRLFETILEIHSRGLVPEYGLMVSTLMTKGLLDDCGGESYLTYLFNQEYDESNFEEFAHQVISSYKSRELLNITNNTASRLHDDSNIDRTISWLRNSIDRLSTSSGDGVVNLDMATTDAYNVLIETVNNPTRNASRTGIASLDGVTGGFWEGDMWVIAGRPGMGKSAVMCNAVLSGEPSIIFSLEMNKVALINRLLAIKSGIPIFKIRFGDLNQEELNKIVDTIEEIRGLPIYIDTTFSLNLDYVLSTIRKYHKLYGIKVAHLDYIQILVERSESAVHDLGRVSREFKLLSNDLGITAVIYSQLNRLVEGRNDKRPILSDLRQSGNLEEDADIVIMLYRDEVYDKDAKNKGEIELLIRKHRNGPIGMIGANFEDVTNLITTKET